MTHNTTRRSVVRGAAWTVPVVAVATAAPAFAASSLVCTPTAECKLPGEGSNTKDYAIRTGCVTGSPVATVEVYDNQAAVWIAATLQDDGTWLAPQFNDSRRSRSVRITDTAGSVDISIVDFAPC